MNIRYPIYEGVYRILTYDLSYSIPHDHRILTREIAIDIILLEGFLDLKNFVIKYF